jgi:hypothetical protein
MKAKRLTRSQTRKIQKSLQTTSIRKETGVVKTMLRVYPA